MSRLSSFVAMTLLPLAVVGCSRKPDKYENDDKCEAAKPIAAGETQTHTVHRRRDSDWMKLPVKAGKKYNISITRVTSKKGVGLSVHEACGTPRTQFGSGRRPFVIYRAQKDGDLFIVAGSRKTTTYDIFIRESE